MSGATRFSFDPTEFAGRRALVTGGTKQFLSGMLKQGSGVIVHISSIRLEALT
jgi:hypothetical protein